MISLSNRRISDTLILQINAAFTIKYDAFDAKGKVGFLNTSKVKEADVTFLISVKVVNQVIYDHSLVNFQPVDGVDPKNFTEVYGDSFISGTATPPEDFQLSTYLGRSLLVVMLTNLAYRLSRGWYLYCCHICQS